MTHPENQNIKVFERINLKMIQLFKLLVYIKAKILNQHFSDLS